MIVNDSDIFIQGLILYSAIKAPQISSIPIFFYGEKATKQMDCAFLKWKLNLCFAEKPFE